MPTKHDDYEQNIQQCPEGDHHARRKRRLGRRDLLASAGLAGMAALLPGCASGMAASSHSDSGNVLGSIEGTGIYNVREYGAVGDGETDDSGAFEDAIDAIASAGQGVLYVPPGDYRFDRRVTKSVGRWDFALLGAGQGLSNLHSNNSEGVFQFTCSSRQSQTTIRDLSFLTGRSGGGTALEVSQPAKGNLHKRNLLVENVEVRGAPQKRKTSYFDYGIRSLNQWRPLFLNAIFAGPFGPGVSDEDLLGATCAFQANGSYAPSFQNCYAWSAKTGYEVVSDETPRAPEDANFYRSIAVQCGVGMDIATPSPEPSVQIDTCHINCFDVGIRMRRKFFQITNCLLYGKVFRDEEPTPYTDIQLIDSFGGIISDNIFQIPTNPGRKMIEIDSDCYDIQIKENLFNATGTGIDIAPGAEEIICASNRFNRRSDVLLPRTAVDPVIVDPSRGAVFATDEHRGALLSLAGPQRTPGGEWAPVRWGKAEHDTESFWQEAAGDKASGVVVPANRGIHYVQLTANVAWGENSEGAREVQFTRGGKPFAGGGHACERGGSPPTAGPSPHTQNVQSAIVPVEAGDVFNVRVRQTSGDALDLVPGPSTWFAVDVVDG